MMHGDSLHIWGDSILKGIIYDEARGRYIILRENCITALSETLPVPIVNNARMGQTAPEAVQALHGEDLRPGGLALIEFGGNDCDMPWSEISEHPAAAHEAKTPLDAFQEALEKLVRKIRGGGMQPVLVVPTPLDAKRYFQWISKNLNPAAILSYLGDVERIYRWQEYYANAVTQVACALKCPLLNLREAFLEHPRFKELLCIDGIHPNAEGHQVMLQSLQSGLAML